MTQTQIELKPVAVGTVNVDGNMGVSRFRLDEADLEAGPEIVL
jgi:hypothetical protein